MGYTHYPSTSSSGVPTYATAAALPALATDGALGVVLDADQLWEFDGATNTWVLIGGPGIAYSIGPLDGAAQNSKGLTLGSNSLYQQSAGAIFPGLVSSAAQTYAGVKTFTQPVQFIVNGSVSFQDGTLYYDNSASGLTFQNSVSSISLQVGQENWVMVQNNSGATIGNGRAVYQSGSIQNSDLPLIGLAQSNTSSTSQFIGLATHDIANGATGFVTQSGKVHGLDTSQYAPGQRVWLSAASAGFYQVADPQPPNYSVFIGYVLNSGSTTGSIFLSSIRNSSIVPFLNPMTSSGDLIVGSASGLASRLPLGAGNTVLTTSSGSNRPSWNILNVATQTQGSVSLVNQVVGNLPLSQTSGSISLTNQVVGSLLSNPDGLYSIGSSSFASSTSFRFFNAYFSNAVTTGVFPAVAAKPYAILTSTGGLGGLPGVILFSGGSSGYQYSADTASAFIGDTGAAVRLFNVFGGAFDHRSSSTGIIYVAGSTTAFLLNKIPLQLAGSTSGSVVSVKADDNTNKYDFIFPQSVGTSSWVLQAINGVGSTGWVNALTNPMTTSGDMIVGSGSGVASRFAGTTSNSASFLMQTGSGSASALPIWTPVKAPTIETLSSTGTYTVKTGAIALKVTVVGGGGGGGGTASTAASNGSGAGGGGGGTAIKWFINSSISATYAYSVCQGGFNAGPGNNAGSAASSSAFGAIAATGGAGGGGSGGNVAIGFFTGGATTAGTGIGGDININGSVGLSGFSLAAGQFQGGAGGSSAYGVGGAAVVNASSTGNAGSGFGGGGGGGTQSNNGGSAGGGTASFGTIIVETYFP